VTTIAFKARTLAADTQWTVDDMRVYTRKLWPVGNKGCLGIAGESDVEKYFYDWFIAGEHWDQWDFGTLKKSKFEVMYIDQFKDVFWFQNGPGRMKVDHNFHAIGSGSKLAMAAMHMGMSAKEAIEFASELDVYTNSLIDVYDTQTGRLTLCKWPPSRPRQETP
jgi:hypothetical protein